MACIFYDQKRPVPNLPLGYSIVYTKMTRRFLFLLVTSAAALRSIDAVVEKRQLLAIDPSIATRYEALKKSQEKEIRKQIAEEKARKEAEAAALRQRKAEEADRMYAEMAREKARKEAEAAAVKQREAEEAERNKAQLAQEKARKEAEAAALKKQEAERKKAELAQKLRSTTPSTTPTSTKPETSPTPVPAPSTDAESSPVPTSTDSESVASSGSVEGAETKGLVSDEVSNPPDTSTSASALIPVALIASALVAIVILAVLWKSRKRIEEERMTHFEERKSSFNLSPQDDAAVGTPSDMSPYYYTGAVQDRSSFYSESPYSVPIEEEEERCHVEISSTVSSPKVEFAIES